MGMRVRGISETMRRIWVEMQKMWGIRAGMQRIKVEILKYSGRNHIRIAMEMIDSKSEEKSK